MHARQKHLTTRQKRVISAVSIGIFVLLTAAICWFVGKPMLQFVAEPERFRAWVDERGLMGRLLFVGMMTLQVVIAIIPGEPLEIGAGYAFGIGEGTLLCMLGILLGSMIIYGFVKRFGIRAVEAFFSLDKVRGLKFLQDPKRLKVYTFIAFFIPGTPKDMLSYVVPLTNISLPAWLLITGTARIPSVITSTIGGDALGVQEYQFAIIVFAATLLISAVGLLVFNKMYKKKES